MRRPIHGPCISRVSRKGGLSGNWCTLSSRNAFRAQDLESTFSHRIDLEGMCSRTWEHIVSTPNEWIYHSEGMQGRIPHHWWPGEMTRTICAAPRERVHLPPGFPNIIQCCHNSPVLGGKHAKASKYCSEHKQSEQTQANPAPARKHYRKAAWQWQRRCANWVQEARKSVPHLHCRHIGSSKTMWCCGEFHGNVHVWVPAYVFLRLKFGERSEDLQSWSIVVTTERVIFTHLYSKWARTVGLELRFWMSTWNF